MQLIRSVGLFADGDVLFQFRDEGSVAAGKIGVQLQLHVQFRGVIRGLGLADVENQRSKYNTYSTVYLYRVFHVII